MSPAGYSTVATTVQKTDLVLKDIEEAYGWPKERREQAWQALRAVLHALRDRLIVQEAADMAAQLPLLIRGLFFEGWNPSKVPVKMNREEFLDRVRSRLTFELPDDDIQRLVTTVLNALKRFVTEGEWEDIKSTVSKDLRDLLP